MRVPVKAGAPVAEQPHTRGTWEHQRIVRERRTRQSLQDIKFLPRPRQKGAHPPDVGAVEHCLARARTNRGHLARTVRLLSEKTLTVPPAGHSARTAHRDREFIFKNSEGRADEGGTVSVAVRRFGYRLRAAAAIGPAQLGEIHDRKAVLLVSHPLPPRPSRRSREVRFPRVLGIA